MEHCHICKKTGEEFGMCEGCGEDVCPDCCTDSPPQKLIDFPYCKTCAEITE